MDQSTELQSAISDTPALYTHSMRPQWGLAIMAWERGPRRAFQFEDGQLRVFRKGYYDRLQEVDVPADEYERAVAEFERALGRQVQRQESKSKRKKKIADALPFEDQVRIFTMQHPEGFDGDDWLKKRRGVDVKKTLKRHREPAIEAASKMLPRMRKVRDADDAVVMTRELLELVASTSLVTKKQLAPLQALDAIGAEALVSSLIELIDEDEPSALAMGRYLAAISAGKPASWQLATAIPALFAPDHHICVRPATIKRQAAWMAPRLTLTRRADVQIYLRIRQMAMTLADELTDVGQVPRDLFDVYDFMLETLAPKARELLSH